MTTPRTFLEGLINWLSPTGGISRTVFFRHYLVPAVLITGLVGVSGVPDLILVPVAVLYIGIKKRFKDAGVKISGFRASALGVFAVASILIAVVVAFFLFLAGISGAGDKDMLQMAGIVFAAPFVLLIGLPVLYALVAESAPKETEQGPIADSSTGGQSDC